MIEVNQKETETWLASLLLKGTGLMPHNPQDRTTWLWAQLGHKKLDVPDLMIKKETTREKNVKKITYYLKVKFNLAGRKRKLYKEWPRAFLNTEWYNPWYFAEGLATDNGDGTMTLIDGRGNGKAIYTIPKDGENMSLLVAYEGTVA